MKDGLFELFELKRYRQIPAGLRRAAGGDGGDEDDNSCIRGGVGDDARGD